MVNDDETVIRLRQVAARLTADIELRKDLVQEMHLHFLKSQQSDPGKPLEWYFKGCEFRARNYMKLGRSIDSLKRARRGVSLSPAFGHGEAADMNEQLSAPDHLDLRLELMTTEIVHLVAKHLKPRQQQTLELLIKGCGVRETARRLGISHPAVIKHRRKIARLAAGFLQADDQPSAPSSRLQQFAGKRASTVSLPPMSFTDPVGLPPVVTVWEKTSF